MACFLITAGEAVVTTVVAKVVESKEEKADILKINTKSYSVKSDQDTKIPFSRKLKWLKNLLWGGSFLLAFEHVWHGEVVPWFPFLTAAGNAADAVEMLHEMATVGVAMAAVVTAVWAGMVLVSNAIEKRIHKEQEAAVKGDTV